MPRVSRGVSLLLMMRFFRNEPEQPQLLGWDSLVLLFCKRESMRLRILLPEGLEPAAKLESCLTLLAGIFAI